MTEQTVGQLAETIDVPVERLLLQIAEAKLPQQFSEDNIGEEERQQLLAHLQKNHGEAASPRKEITLKRRVHSTIKSSSKAGRGRTVNVEVRKRRTYAKQGTTLKQGALDGEQAADALSPLPAALDPELDVEHKRQAAATNRLAERQARQEREVAEQKRKEAAEAKAKAGVIAKAEADKAAAKTGTPQSAEEGGEITKRKDRRDRHDFDDEERQQKKLKHGNRKHRVEELITEHLLEETDVDATEESLAAIADELNVDEQGADEKVTKGKATKEKTAKGKTAKGKTAKGKVTKGKTAKSKTTKGKAAKGKKEDEAVTLGLSSPRTKRVAKPMTRHRFTTPTEEITREVELGQQIRIQQLSRKMSVKATDVIKMLAKIGVEKTGSDSIDQDVAVLVVEEFGHKVKLLASNSAEKQLEDDLVYEVQATPRAPVVTVMGHVDHGKTSLLDYIRESQVATGESGGITQHIGAYRVTTAHGEVCFIDTPGHAAFTAMRARGAEVTDIVILVVAADDGVMPQTEEAIQHAKSAGVPVVVALNKMDKEDVDPEKVKNELAACELIPDDWGGDTQFIQVSATTGAGVEELLEAVLLQAELLELSAAEQGPAQGVVIESSLDKAKGPVVTLLVQKGRLNQGDIVIAGQQFGRARALSDEHGTKVKSAGPATPVLLLGLNDTPESGDSFLVTKDERRAREAAGARRTRAKESRMTASSSLDRLLDSFGAEETRKLNIVLKADARGSLEAISTALAELGNDEVQVNVVIPGLGGITESDAIYAVTTGAVIFGFNVRADNAAKRIIEAENLDLRYYKVIYDLLDDVKVALSGMLTPEIREEIIGIAEVRDVFQSRKMGLIAGCLVTEGSVSRQKKIRILRDNIVIYEGELESLRRFKDEVDTIASGVECGIGVKNYNDVKVKDLIEVFDTREVAREIHAE